MAVDAARAKALFLEASELADPSERTAYLKRECGGDAELRQRVVALLVAHDGGGRSVEGDAAVTSELTSPETQEATTASRAETRLPSELATAEDRSDGADFKLARAPRVDRPGESGVGQVIAGRYTVREVLGEGGMGTVYMAEQTAAGQAAPGGPQADRRSAWTRSQVLARFDAEAARRWHGLDGPPQHLQRVHDGGTHATRAARTSSWNW